MRNLGEVRLAFSDESKVSYNWLCFFSKKASRGDIKNNEKVRERKSMW